MARDEAIAGAIAEAVRWFGVPILGMAFTAHETVYKQKGVEMVPEFYADPEYDGDGNLILSRRARCGRSGAGDGAGPARDARSCCRDDVRARHSDQGADGVRTFRYAGVSRHCRGFVQSASHRARAKYHCGHGSAVTDAASAPT